MGLDMYLYARKKDTYNKIPKEYLINYGENFYDVNSSDDFVEKIGKENLYELIKSNNIFVHQEVIYTWSSLSVVKEVGYWRKANAIHNWFVENVQNGEDDCDYYVVTKEQLEKLGEICKEVLETLNDDDMEIVKDEDGYEVEQYKNTELAEELLPTQKGFFFGGTNYTKYYKEDLEETIKICNKCQYIKDDFEILYHSSW